MEMRILTGRGHRQRVSQWLMLLFTLTIASGCGDKTLQRKDLHIKIQEAQSLAKEGLLFAQLKAGGDLRRRFVSAHGDAMHTKASKLVEELGKATAEPTIESQFESLKNAAAELERLLIDPQNTELKWQHVTADLARLDGLL